MRQIRLAAPAKVNLHLEILRRRDDGFHELETLFQTLELHDVVSVAETSERGIALRCDDAALPAGPENLAWRAAAAFAARCAAPSGIAIALEKRVPHGAGLGGGSSDAAAVLRALARLAPAPPDPDTLHNIAAQLGSDVPFFLVGGCAHATGRGDRLTALDDLPPSPVTVLVPGEPLPTPAVYRALTDAERGPRAPLGAASVHARFAGGAGAALTNRLTGPARRLSPAVDALLAWLAGRGVPHLLSGSGSACFALAEIDPPPGVRAIRTRFRGRTRLDALDG